jgi:hypothetical protein
LGNKIIETSALSITIGVKCIDRTNSTLFSSFDNNIDVLLSQIFEKLLLLSSLEKYGFSN